MAKAGSKITLFFVTFLLPNLVTAGENLTADRAVALALANNLNIKITRFDEELAALSIEGQQSAYDITSSFLANHTIDKQEPAVAVFGSENKETNFRGDISKTFTPGTRSKLFWTTQRLKTNSQFTTLNPTYTTSLGIEITQPLLQNFLGRIEKLGVKAAELQRDITVYQVEDQVEAIIAQVLQAYWDLRFSQQNVTFAQEAMKWASTLAASAVRNRNLGVSESDEVVSAQANESVRRQTLSEAEASRERASLLMSRLLHAGSITEITAADPLISDKTGPLQSTSTVEEAIDNRREIKILHTSSKLIDLDISRNRSQLLPSLELTGALTLNGLDANAPSSHEELFTTNTNTYFIGGALTYNWDNKQYRSALKKAQIEKEQQDLTLSDLISQIRFELRDADVLVRSLENIEKQARNVVKLQKEKLDIESRRLKQGRSNTNALVRIQDDLINAQRNLARTALSLKLAYIKQMRLRNSLLSHYTRMTP